MAFFGGCPDFFAIALECQADDEFYGVKGSGSRLERHQALYLMSG